MRTPRLLVASACAALMLGASLPTALAQEPPQTPAQPEGGSPAAVASAAPALAEGFAVEGQWVASGVVWLDWDDVAAAAGYELMFRGAGGWLLLSEREPMGGVGVIFEGSSARVAGLPGDAAEYWFAFRARNASGVSVWSHSIGVEVPEHALSGPPTEARFDPFTAPTRSGIDLERLREAVATITPGQADCSSVPALDVTGITVVDPPADLEDPDAELTVAEVVRIAGGCLVVQYVALAGRTVDEVRSLLVSEPSVHAVGEPIRGVRVAHPGTDYSGHSGAHYQYGGSLAWHLPQPTMNALWDGWQATTPVTVAVLDTGVDSSHPDLDDQIVTGGLTACHRVDFHGHGTHVAGIVAAEHDRRPGAVNDYAAGDASVLPVRVLERDTCEAGMGPTEAVAVAVNHGARVINMSLIWSSGERSDEDQQVGGIPIDSDVTSDTFELALRAASMLGVVSVAAAGNCGSDLDADGDGDPSWKENRCSGHNFDHAPAIYSRTGDVITVAAIESSAQRRASSTAKDFVDIAAPGGAILSTVPLSACNAEDTDGDTVYDRWTPLECGTGDGTRDPLTECPDSEPRRMSATQDPPASGCAHRVFGKSGTSMAAPFVAGVVAHMLNRHAEATVGQVREALEESVKNPPPHPDPAMDWTPRGRDGDDKIVLPTSKDAPTAEYGRGIIDPAGALATLEKLVNEAEAADLGGFKEIDAGGRHSCGLRSSGRVRCWGDSGLAANAPGLAFQQVSAPTGPADHACGINLSRLEPGGAEYGTALCWGADSSSVPRVVEGTLTQVATGFARSCGLRPDDTVLCWDNDTGVDREAPGGEFASISGGWLHFCGRRADGSAACWGDNSDGQIDVPKDVKFLSVDAGGFHSCGVTVDRVVRCWGRGSSLPASGEPVEAHTELGGVWVYGWSGDLWGDSYRLVRCDPDGDPCYSAGSNWHFGYRSDSRNDRDWSAAEGHWLYLDGQYVKIPDAADAEFKLLNVPAFDREAYVLWDTGVSASWTFPQYGLDSASGPALRVESVDAGHSHTCALEANRFFGFSGGAARCWGANSHGQADPPPEGFKEVTAGWRHSCGRVWDATLRCWGDDSSGQAPQGRLESLSLTASGTELIAFDPDVTEYLVAAQPVDATLTWAIADHGTSGPADDPPPADADPAAAGHQVELIDGAVIEVTVKALFGFGETRTYRIQVGEPPRLTSLRVLSEVPGPQCRPSCPALALSPAFASNMTDYSVTAPADVSQVTVTYTAAGGEAAVDPVDAEPPPADGPDASPGHQIDVGGPLFDAVDAGWTHSCGLLHSGVIECWGGNDDGETDAPSGQFSSISSGGYHSCGFTAQGALVCWGWNLAGQTTVPAGMFTAVDAGILHNCGLKSDRSVQCWGWNHFGQTNAPSGQFSAVSAGSGHSCGLKTDATVRCWGYNASGQTSAPSGSFSAVTAGWSHSCGLKSDNTVECWGHNEHGQSTAPSGSFSAVSAGWHHSCGLKSDNTVECWGRNDDGQSTAPSGSFTSVAAGRWHTCGLRTGKRVECWGDSARLPETPGPAVVTITVTSSRTPTLAATYTLTIEPAAQSSAATQQHSPRSGVPRSSDPFELAGLPRPGSSEDASNDAPGSNSSVRDASAEISSTACAAASGDAADTVIVEIADDTLRHEIERMLAKAPGEQITASEMATVTSLSADIQDAAHGEIKNLEGLQYATGLAVLNLYGHGVSDLDALACLSNLTSLSLARNHVSDIAALSGLTGLRELYLYDNQITDVAALSGLSNLTVLYLDHNQISDVSALSGLSGLEVLGLGDNRISDVSALGGLTGLDSLYLFDNDLVSIDALGPVIDSGLRVLWADGNRLSTAGRVSRLPRLAYLDMRHNELVDVDPPYAIDAVVHALPQRDTAVEMPDAALAAAVRSQLGVPASEPLMRGRIAKLRRLAHIGTDGARIVSLEGLQHATALVELRLRDNRIRDISALAGLENLQRLDLQDNGFTDLAQLGALASLRWLSLTRNGVTSLAAMPAMGGLEQLYLAFNQISDIEPLASHHSLTDLGLVGNQITDTGPLAQLTQLQSLQISGNRISDIGALGALTGLTVLRLSSNPIADHTPLNGLANLTELHLYRTRIADLEPLRSLISVEFLDIRDNNITSLQPLQGLTSLQDLYIGDNHITDFTPLEDITGLTIHGQHDQTPSS